MKALLFTCSLFFISQVSASQDCHLSLAQDMQITPQDVSLRAQQHSRWRISPNGQLWLDEQLQKTTAESRDLLQQYQQQIRLQTANTLLLVNDALQLATDAVEQVFTELTGQAPSSDSALPAAFNHLRESIALVIREQGDTLVFNASQFTDVEQAFGAEFDAAMASMVEELMGSLLAQASSSLFSGSGTFEQRMTAFAERMEAVGENIEQKMQTKAAQLEQQAATLCQELTKLSALEAQLNQQVPALQAYPLVTAQPMEL